MKRIILFSLIVAAANAAKFPSYFRKCKIEQKDFDKCIFEAARAGIKLLDKPHPDINLPSFHPLVISEFNVPAGSLNVVNFEQKYKDCKFYGIPEFDLRKFQLNFKEKKLQFNGTISKLQKDCTYNFNGKILILPISGEGPSHIVLTNLDVDCELEWDEVQNNGKTYFKVHSPKVRFNPEHVSYELGNLLNGQKDIGNNINKVLNDNWLEIWNDIKSGYETGIGLIIKQVLNNFLSALSKEELLY